MKKVELGDSNWMLVLEALAQLPYAKVAPTINEIVQQLKAQEENGSES